MTVEDEHQNQLAREENARHNELLAMIDAAQTPEDLLAVLWGKADEDYGDCAELDSWMIFDLSGTHYGTIKYILNDCLEAVTDQYQIDKSTCERCESYYTNKGCDNCTAVVYSEANYYQWVSKVAGALAIFWGKVAEAK